MGSLGWEIAFCPGIVSPFGKPAQMWWEKFVFMAGRTETLEGIVQMLERRYMALSKEPEKRRALSYEEDVVSEVVCMKDPMRIIHFGEV